MNEFYQTSLPRSTSFSDGALFNVYLDRLNFIRRNTSLKSERRMSMLRELHDLAFIPAFEVKDDAIVICPSDVTRCARSLINAHNQFTNLIT